ncbi:MAG: zinc-binding dehydrogenase [archaeon GBS-70-058]|nr:zinc-binding dehydrogenase [Candidatus Culexarchaeum nevadense]
MKAAILRSPKNITLSEIQTPLSPRSDEAIVKVKYAAICGTDLHLYRGETPAKYPVILGHEYAGEVLMVGQGVRNIKPGDRVIGSYMASCGKCRFCILGKPQLCERRLMFGINIDGSFAEYMKIPLAERVLVKIPEELDYRDAVLVADTFLTAFNAVEKALKPGETLLITGLGSIGLSAALAAKIMGASTIIGTARRERPIKIAKELGVKYVLNPDKEDVVKKVMDLTNGYGVDASIEASGAQKNMKIAFESLKPGGKMIQVAIPVEAITMDLKYIIGLEKSIIGVLNPGTPPHIERALKTVKNEINSLRSIVTHEYSLDEIEKALEIMDKRIGDPIKILLKIS